MVTIKLFTTLVLSFLLLACNPSTQTISKHNPVAFETSDECHVCGMIISRFEGPKGQAYDTRQKQMKKFCSTSELVFWYLQPENKSNVSEIYVHDMAQTPWDKPDDKHLISAKNAFYVIGSKKNGSMGKTLASFSSKKDAYIFSGKQGGQVIEFNQLTLETLSNS